MAPSEIESPKVRAKVSPGKLGLTETGLRTMQQEATHLVHPIRGALANARSPALPSFCFIALMAMLEAKRALGLAHEAQTQDRKGVST